MSRLTIINYINTQDQSIGVLKKLEVTMMEIAREDPMVRKFYVGIASGPDHERALKRRFDKTKRRWGINLMVAIYETPYEFHCRFAEAHLEKHFKRLRHHVVPMDAVFNNAKLLNQTGGGGGRPSDQERHFIYVAVKHLGF
jgi:hypothetical protein